MQDLVSFTKSVTNNETIIQYMRNYFEQNFALYSVLSRYRGYEATPELDGNGMLIYRLTALHADENAVQKFINEVNGQVITVYGNAYIISIDRAPNMLLLRFSKI